MATRIMGNARIFYMIMNNTWLVQPGFRFDRNAFIRSNTLRIQTLTEIIEA